MVAEKLMYEGVDRMMSYFGRNFLDPSWPRRPLFWPLLTDVSPGWLLVICVTPVGLKALSSGGQTLVLYCHTSAGLIYSS